MINQPGLLMTLMHRVIQHPQGTCDTSALGEICSLEKLVMDLHVPDSGDMEDQTLEISLGCLKGYFSGSFFSVETRDAVFYLTLICDYLEGHICCD